MRKHALSLFNAALVLVTIIGGYLVVVHRQDIVDWWTLRTYTPPAAVAQLAADDTMTDHGRDIFYASQPQIEASAQFNQHCSSKGEKTVVLGCYAAQRIYVYDVTDARLAGVQQVTAAHEMLHAAYDRLDAATKNQVNQWLQAEISVKKDTHLQNLINLYNQQEPGELLNEMHSILGTEYGDLSPQLENYYKQYFANRAAIVDYANKYKAAFTASQDAIAKIDQQLGSLKQQVDANNAELERQKSSLDAQSARLDTLRANSPGEYNKEVPTYNASVDAYNNLIAQTRDLVQQYNQLVAQHNSEAAAQNDLYNSLDSHYQTVSN